MFFTDGKGGIQERLPHHRRSLLVAIPGLKRLLGCCKLQDVNPYDYLQDFLERLPEKPINRPHELLPPNCKPAKLNIKVGN